jgi:hypothetical protein
MNKNFVTSITLMVFIVFTFSCYSTKQVNVDTIVSKKGEKVKILAVLKTSGERIEFSKKKPGEIVDNKIVGVVVGKDGKEKPVSIPLSEVDQLWMKKLSGGKTFLAVVGGITAAIAISLAIALATKESCPFVYSFDGERYVFDAEPYGGAICQGLKRTEWCGLQYLKEVNGEYRLLLTNEVDETQYTDELKLLVVDHPAGVRVVPSPWGSLHTISDPITPLSAYDQKGNDLMPYVGKNDWIYWRSRDDEKDPDQKQDMKDELILEFPKPKQASKAKLIFNGCNTLWGSQSLKRYLELYGENVFSWYDEVKSFGPAFFKMENTHLREELFSLRIRVETLQGWKTKGIIIGGGPFVSEDKVYTLNLDDVPGDTLKIKLTPPAVFWMINYIAVDYTEDLLVKYKEVKAMKIVDNTGRSDREVRAVLAENDNDFLEMPNIGDSVELIFASPTRPEGMERTLILKAGGYYDIHLKAKGKPQLEILNRIHSEPGFVVRYAFKEYIDWKATIMGKIAPE